MSDEMLSPHFALSEFWRSASRPDLTERPPLEAIDRLRVLARTVLEPLRADLKLPIRILSGYRNAALNTAVGGSPTSQHVHGEAADIRVLAWRPIELLRLLMTRGEPLPLGQVIAYPAQNFVHVALPGHRYRTPCYFYAHPSAPKSYRRVVSVAHLDALFPPSDLRPSA